MATACTRLVLVGDTTLTYALLHEVARRASEHATLAAARPVSAESLQPDHSLPPWTIDRVLVVGAAADEMSEEWARIAPRYRGDLGAASPAYEFVQGALGLAHEVVDRDPMARTVVVVTDARDEVVRNQAGRLARLHPQVVVHVRGDTQPPGLATEPSHDQLHVFGLTLLPSSSPPEDSWTRLARLQHEVYIRREAERGEVVSATHLPWAQLDDSVREDNLRQIRTLIENVVRLGYAWRSDQKAVPSGIAEPDVMRLSELEHERWCDLRRSQGWRYGPVRDPSTKRSPYLVAWSDLHETDRRRTVDGVRGVIERMATIGLAPHIRMFRRIGEVRARRLTEPVPWTSGRGDPLQGASGDWLIIDPSGGQRTVAADRFSELYQPVGGDRYQRSGTVRAVQVSSPTKIQTREGVSTAHPGDWVVHGPDGESWPVPAAEFARSYEEIT
jgi:hypothetical protein